MRRRRRNAKMAERVEDLFHDGMQFSLAKLGYPNLELKKEQYDVLERNAWTKICAECCQRAVLSSVAWDFRLELV